MIQNSEKIHNVPNLVKLAARPIQPAPAPPDTPKSTVPAVTSAKLLSLSAIPIQAVSAAPPISPVQATSTPIKALYPRAVLTPGTPGNKTINICLSNNGILRSQQSPAVSATTKYLLTNKIGQIRQNNGLAASGERETSIQIPQTSTEAVPVGQNTKPQGDTASVLPVTLASSVRPANLRSPTEHPVLTPIVTTTTGQMGNFRLSRLLTEPIDPNGSVSRKFFFLSYDVAVIQWITSRHKNRITTLVKTLWRVHVLSLTTTVSAMRFLIEILFILKAVKSQFKSHMINRILRSWSFHMKFI